MGCIVADGSYLKPLIITKRKTIETSLIQKGLNPNNVMLAYSENGYMTEKIFNEWIEKVFIPYIQNQRKLLNNFEGKGVVICDGFAAHLSKFFFDECEKNNIQIFLLPSHSSHITQPLDLGVFAQHKNNTKIKTKKQNKKNEIEDEDLLSDSEMVEIIWRLFTGWQKAATIDIIISAFQQAGFYLKTGGPSFAYVDIHPEKSRCYKELWELWEKQNAQIYGKFGEMSKEERENLEKILSVKSDENDSKEKERKTQNQEKNKINSTIPISQFNEKIFADRIKELKTAIQDPQKNTIFQNLLQAIVPAITTENITEPEINRKGRPKKEDTAPIPGIIPGQAKNYVNFSFYEKINFELESLQLINPKDLKIEQVIPEEFTRYRFIEEQPQ